MTGIVVYNKIITDLPTITFMVVVVVTLIVKGL